jgi:hypothetical protein
MNWAITLIIANYTSIENRMKNVLSYLFTTDNSFKCILSSIDATGNIGGHLTQQLNKSERSLQIDNMQLLELCNEDGQIIEIDLALYGHSDFRIIIRDGNSIDILGDKNELPAEVIGPFEYIDVKLF